MIADREAAPNQGRPRPVLVPVLLVVTALAGMVAMMALIPGPLPLLEALAGTVAPVVSLLGGVAGLLALVVSRRGTRVIATALTAVALLPLALAVPGWVARPQPGAHRMTVLSFNDLGGEGDPTRLLGVARERHVDLIGLVECNPRCVKRMTPVLSAGGYSLRGATNQEWGHRAYSGIALYALPAVGTGPVTKVWTSTGQVAYGAITTTATVRGMRTRVVIAHLANALNGPRTWMEDHARLEEVLRGPAPVLVTGDLNTTSFHGRLLRTLHRTGTTDCATQLGRLGHPTWGVVQHPSLLQIDHALVRGLGCADQGSAIVPRSDHRALITTVSTQ